MKGLGNFCESLIAFLIFAGFHKLFGSSELRLSCNTPCLLVSDTDRIFALDYDNNSSFSVISNLTHAVAVHYHYRLGYMFWSDARELNIKRSNMDGTNITVIHNDMYCEGLAVEWNSLQLYWTDALNGTIMVSDFNGYNKHIVLFSRVHRPTGIVLDPYKGLMFWTDWRGPPKIERSYLNGTWRVSIVTSNLSWPSGTALDRRSQRLFWVDERMYIIESADYNGNNRKFLFRRRNFFGITFASSNLFVTEWGRNGVYKVDASNGTLMGYHNFSSRGTKGVVAYDNKINATAYPVLMKEN